MATPHISLTTPPAPRRLRRFGCRVVQKALEVLGDKHRQELCAELEGHVMTCVKDENGNHVIQKCIEQVGARSDQVGD